MVQLVSFFSCDQACLSHLYSLCPHHRIVMKFSGVININIERSDVNPMQPFLDRNASLNSHIACSEKNVQYSNEWNDAQSLMCHRRGVLLFFKVICQILRSYRKKIIDFDPNWAFLGRNSIFNSQMSIKCYLCTYVVYHITCMLGDNKDSMNWNELNLRWLGNDAECLK